MTLSLGGTFREPLAAPEPAPPPGETARWDQTRLRRRMLYGLAAADFKAKVLDKLKSFERADAWGSPDPTGNLFPPICRHLAQTYAPDAPRVSGPRATQAVVEAVEAGGLWSLLVRGQRDTIGLREWLVRVDPIEDPAATLGYTLAYRPVFPDRVTARPRRDAPDLPGYLAEAVQLQYTEDTEPRWYWDVWDVTNEAAPVHEIRSDLGPAGIVRLREVGPPVLDDDGRRVAGYPYWDATGPVPRPVIPYSLYHAERTGYLWDPWEWSEVVEGCLELVAKWTFAGHVLLKAAWPQRYSIGVDWGGDLVERDDDENGTRRPQSRVISDPAVVLTGTAIASEEAAGPPIVGQWQLSADPEKAVNAVLPYERRVVGLAGISPGNLSRVSDGHQSGYALAISRDEQIEARARFRPAFERADLETLRVSAAVLGSVTGVALPTRGYALTYGPLTVAEIAAAVKAGTMDVVEAVARLVRDHGMDAQSALSALTGATAGQEVGDGGRDTGGSRSADKGAGDGEGRGEGRGGGASGEDRDDGS